jgi:hypothetical protein
MRFFLVLAFAVVAHAQCGGPWTSFVSSTTATNLSGAMDNKLGFQCGAGAPGTSYACTVGKDLYFNTTNNDLYKCTTTGAVGAATWGLVTTTKKICQIVIGADNGAPLITADIAPQTNQCYVPYNSHITEIMINADAASAPAVVVAYRNPANVVTDLSTSLTAPATAANRACANPAGSGLGSDGVTTCSVALTGSATVAVAGGSWIETHSSTTSSTAKKLSIAVTYTVD